MGSCNICSKPSTLLCSECRDVFYCDRIHQRLDWKTHKKLCGTYEVATSEQLGRYAVAKRDIKSGEVILKEIPLVSGPKTASYPLCLGCHRLLTVRPLIRCRDCGWPICDYDCPYLEERHRNECRLMSSRGYINDDRKNSDDDDNSATRRIVPDYCCITPIRCLLLDKKRSDRLFNLQSNLLTKESSRLYEIHKRSLVPFIRDVLKLDYDQRTILRVAAILDTNCFEIKRARESVKIRACYAKASMLAHDCRPNAKHTIEGDRYELRITAVDDIPKGVAITVSYTQTLWPTRTRRRHLWESKQFWCRCERCSDPTEFATYIGSYLCATCESSYVISIEPLNSEADWTCVGCGKIYKVDVLRRVDDYWKGRIERLSTSKDLKNELKNFLNSVNKKNSPSSVNPNCSINRDSSSSSSSSIGNREERELRLHDNNSYVLEARYGLLQLLSRSPTGVRSNELTAVIDDYQKLINVANVLEPGNSSFREQLLISMETLRRLTIS